MLTFQRVHIQSVHDNELSSPYEIRLSEKLFKLFGIDFHQSVEIYCGISTVVCECMPLETNGGEYLLQCSISLLNTLHLPLSGINIHLSYNKKLHQFYLGPIISVLTTESGKEGREKFGPITKFCEEMATYAKKKHIFFYVLPINKWSSAEPKGYIYENDEWLEHTVPIAEVMYNRIGSRKIENSALVQAIFSELINLNIAIFNDHFLDKWEVYQTLLKYEEMQPHLPITSRFDDENSLAFMLTNHSLLFIKPENGSQGKGIYQLELDDNHFKLRSSSFNGKHERFFHSLKGVYNTLKKRIHKRPYIVQQAIPLKRLNGRSLDFRILCCRTFSGEWRVISAVARVSAEEKFVANIAQGGELHSIDKALDFLFTNNQKKQLKAFLYELSIESVQILSNEIDGDYGEFGVDIGLDEEGFPWIIEINTKPSKNYLPEFNEPTIRPSAKTIIQYGYYLSNFPNRRLMSSKEMQQDKDD